MKLDRLYSILPAVDYAVIALTETWLSESVFNAEICNNSFSIYRSDRNFAACGLTRGGGVILLINNCTESCLVNFGEFSSLIPLNVDIVCAKIKLDGRYLYIFNVYVPPKLSANGYLTLFEFFEALPFLYDNNFLIVGDFNIPEYVLNTSTNIINSFHNFLHYFDLKQYNSIRNSNGRILDFVISNIFCSVSSEPDSLITVQYSHHPSISIKFDKCYSHDNLNLPNVSFANYNFKKADFVKLYSLIENYDWNSLAHFTDVNKQCDFFYTILYDMFSQCVPFKSTYKFTYPPWFTHLIKLNIKRKAHYLKMHRKFPHISFYLEQYKNLRSQIKKDIKTSYTQYVRNCEISIESDPSKFWKYIQSKRNTSSIPSSMTFENSVLNSPSHIVNAFAKYFHSVFTIPTTDPLPPLLSYSNNLISLDHISVDDIMLSIKTLKPSLSCGPDLVPAMIIKDCSTPFSSALFHIFNLSIKTCTFPSLWKLARITPIHKSGDVSDISNYRPIAVLSNFSKVLESIIYKAIYPYIHNLLSFSQHGFVKQRSTVTNLSFFTHFLSTILDNNGQVDVAYTDFSKAFDRLDHRILIHKLHSFSLSSSFIQLISSYLNHRLLFVNCLGVNSTPFIATSGVPQGSNLGPLLFLLFINDVTHVISNNKLLFADDLKIFASVTSIDDCIKLQNDLDNLNKWCIANKLFLNLNKCKILTFTRSHNLILHDYSISNSVLVRVDEMCDLGVTYDTKLNFNRHVHNIVKSSCKMLGFIIRNTRNFINLQPIFCLYFAFVRSKLEYCSIIWNPLYFKNINLIESVQKKFLKFIYFKVLNSYPPFSLSYLTLLHTFSLTSLSQRRTSNAVQHLHKLLHNTVDDPISLNLLNINVPSFYSRHSNTFYLPYSRTNVSYQSPILFMCSCYHLCQSQQDIFS